VKLVPVKGVAIVDIPKSPTVYNAMCVSVLLFGCETWMLYRRHFKALEAYHAKSLQKILGLHWWHKVPHTEMRCRADTHSMEHLVMQRQLRWIGHAIRMQSNRLPRRILYSELQHGQRARGGQKKHFSDHVKAILKKCLIPPDHLETLASDREAWKGVCQEGLTAFDINYTTKRPKHVALVDTRSQVLQHPVLAVISVAESARQNSGSGVIFVLTVRLLPMLQRLRRSSMGNSKQYTVLAVDLLCQLTTSYGHMYCLNFSGRNLA